MAFFPKLGQLFPIFEKGQGRPSPRLAPSSYAPVIITSLLTYRVKGRFVIQFCGAVMLNKKFKQNFKMTCGGKTKNGELEIHTMSEDSLSRDASNTESSPAISDYTVLGQETDDHNTPETNLSMTFIISLTR